MYDEIGFNFKDVESCLSEIKTNHNDKNQIHSVLDIFPGQVYEKVYSKTGRIKKFKVVALFPYYFISIPINQNEPITYGTKEWYGALYKIEFYTDCGVRPYAQGDIKMWNKWNYLRTPLSMD